jgi:hypothetical protein
MEISYRVVVVFVLTPLSCPQECTCNNGFSGEKCHNLDECHVDIRDKEIGGSGGSPEPPGPLLTHDREKETGGSGGSLAPRGPLPTHLHAVCMA